MNWKKFISEAKKDGETTVIYTSDDPKDLVDFSLKYMLDGWRVEMQMPQVIKLNKNWKPQDILIDACSRSKRDGKDRKIPYTKEDFERAIGKRSPCCRRRIQYKDMDQKQTYIGGPFQVDGIWKWCNWFERNPIGYKFTLGSDEFTKIAYNRATSSGKFWWYLFNTGELAPAAVAWTDGPKDQNPEDERHLRYLLYFAHDCGGCEKENPGAELICKTCDINFLRDSVTEISRKTGFNRSGIDAV